MTTLRLNRVESRIRQELAEVVKFHNGLISRRVDGEAPKHERRGVSLASI